MLSANGVPAAVCWQSMCTLGIGHLLHLSLSVATVTVVVSPSVCKAHLSHCVCVYVCVCVSVHVCSFHEPLTLSV